LEDTINDINAELDQMRANQPQQAIAAPVADAEITHYIQNMDDIEIAQHLEDWAMDEGMAAPDNWATDTFNDMTPEEYQNITSLRETVRAQLENNPEELQNLRELMGDWEPEAPMTLPALTRVELPLDHEIGGTNYTQMRTMIENATPETIIDVGRQLSGNQGDYGLVEFDDLTDLWVNRNTQLRNAPAEPDMQLTGLAPIPEAVQTHLSDIRSWTDNGLNRNIRNLTEHHPQTLYANLNEEQTARVLSQMQEEVDNRADGMDAGFAEGGEVNIRPSGSYHASKAGNADIKQYTKGLDIDLFNKYGVGITKQGVTVSLPDEKFKQSDISEMRARYRTDDNTEYGISKRPLENRVTLSRSNPKDQSEWRADFSPDYKGISYNKRFAQGGLVYDEQHVSQIANELLGAMNG
jgi:hypothetical protein